MREIPERVRSAVAKMDAEAMSKAVQKHRFPAQLPSKDTILPEGESISRYWRLFIQPDSNQTNRTGSRTWLIAEVTLSLPRADALISGHYSGGVS